MRCVMTAGPEEAMGKQGQSEHASEGLQGASSFFAPFPPLLLPPGRDRIDSAGSTITGLPTVGGSFVGLLLAIARCMAFAPLVDRLDRFCDRVCFIAGPIGTLLTSQRHGDYTRSGWAPVRARTLIRTACPKR